MKLPKLAVFEVDDKRSFNAIKTLFHGEVFNRIEKDRYYVKLSLKQLRYIERTNTLLSVSLKQVIKNNSLL